MAIRILNEKFDPSIPSWVTDNLGNQVGGNLKLDVNLDTAVFHDGYSDTPHGQRHMKTFPATWADIQRDFERGNKPVFLVEFPDEKPILFVYKNRGFERYDWDGGKLSRFKRWRDFKPYITHYGYFTKDDVSKKNKSDSERQKYRDARRLRDLWKEIDPNALRKDYRRGLEHDKKALSLSKEMDKFYDQVDELFDRAIAEVDSTRNPDRANKIYSVMKAVDKYYSYALDNLEKYLANSAGWDYDLKYAKEYFEQSKTFAEELESLLGEQEVVYI